MNQNTALSNTFATDGENTFQPGTAPLVLIVDDHEPSQTVLRMIAHQFGLTPIVADTAQDAIRELNESQNGFDILLMDFLLGADNGLAVAATLHTLANASGKTALMHTLLVTGATDQVTRDNPSWVAAEVAGILPKPISAKMLFGHLEPFHHHIK
ncbi:MAG: response regulator [Hyphomicrobiales bacterium]